MGFDAKMEGYDLVEVDGRMHISMMLQKGF